LSHAPLHYAALGSARSVLRSALLEPIPIRFTIDIPSIIVIVRGRTRSPGGYITLPDIGVGGFVRAVE